VGLLLNIIIDRDSAARLGILPADIDNALYDAFGQRQVSTIYTQLNQYHVVMEVDPQFQQNPDSPQKYLCALVERCASSDDGLHARRNGRRAPHPESPGPISRGHFFVQPRAGRFTRPRMEDPFIASEF